MSVKYTIRPGKPIQNKSNTVDAPLNVQNKILCAKFGLLKKYTRAVLENICYCQCPFFLFFSILHYFSFWYGRIITILIRVHCNWYVFKCGRTHINDAISRGVEVCTGMSRPKGYFSRYPEHRRKSVVVGIFLLLLLLSVFYTCVRIPVQYTVRSSNHCGLIKCQNTIRWQKKNVL